MMYGFESLVRPYIPVIARTKQKVITSTKPLPDVGIRWGKPSRFEYSNAGKEPTTTTTTTNVDYLGKTEKLEGEEVYRKWDRVKIDVDTTGTPANFEFERPVEMFFFMREEEIYSEKPYGDGSNPNHIQPEITTIYHYVKFAFPLNNEEDNIIDSGERGEHPDDILAKTQADFDATLEGQMQKSKEHWEGVFEDISTWHLPSWAGGKQF